MPSTTKDHTIVGSTEAFRSGEFQLEQVSFGGDFHWDNVRARFLSMMGMFATTTPRNDASNEVGQWDLRNAYRYLTLNFQYMPKEWLTWWTEVGYRHSNVPYFSGQGGAS